MTCGASLRLFKPLVEFVLLLLAILCGLSRISDYKHHWSDVFAGLILGTFLAFFFVLRVLELHRVNTTARECEVTQGSAISIQDSNDAERGENP